MHALTAPLSELAEIEEICEERGREPGMLLLSGCVTSQKTHLMYALGKDYGHTLIVLSSEDKAKKLYEEYRFLNENTSYYPAKDLLFYQADIHGKQLVKQRMETLQMMMEAKSQVTVITTIDGFMDELPSEAEIKGDILTISNGEALEFESLKEKIIKLGYDREAQVDGPGQFAVRGGIIDIYPLTEELPIRIEFWGDEVDSIRTFDVDSQRSVENLELGGLILCVCLVVFGVAELLTHKHTHNRCHHKSSCPAGAVTEAMKSFDISVKIFVHLNLV